MNLKETIKQLNDKTWVEVKEKLTRGQRAAVNRGYAVQRCYQDQPYDRPYPFRPKSYFLVKTSSCPKE